MILSIVWGASSASGLMGYEVNVNKNGVDSTLQISSGSTVANTSVSAGDTLSVQVRARNSAGFGEWSDPAFMIVPVATAPAVALPAKIVGVSISLV